MYVCFVFMWLYIIEKSISIEKWDQIMRNLMYESEQRHMQVICKLWTRQHYFVNVIIIFKKSAPFSQSFLSTIYE